MQTHEHIPFDPACVPKLIDFHVLLWPMQTESRIIALPSVAHDVKTHTILDTTNFVKCDRRSKHLIATESDTFNLPQLWNVKSLFSYSPPRLQVVLVLVLSKWSKHTCFLVFLVFPRGMMVLVCYPLRRKCVTRWSLGVDSTREDDVAYALLLSAFFGARRSTVQYILQRNLLTCLQVKFKLHRFSNTYRMMWLCSQ